MPDAVASVPPTQGIAVKAMQMLSEFVADPGVIKAYKNAATVGSPDEDYAGDGLAAAKSYDVDGTHLRQERGI